MTHEEAREFIKQHISQRGNHTPEVTDRLVRYWWGLLNIAVFYGKLKKPKILEIHRMRGCWGSAETASTKRERKNGIKHVHIQMNETFVTRRMFLDILVHEMVHAWEHQYHTVMGHGKRFFAWKNRIKRTVGLGLTKMASEKEYLNG